MTNRPIFHLTIVQHNVRIWRENICAYANRLNPEIMLLNGTSTTDGQTLKILNYNIFKSNKFNQPHKGAAIAIRRDIQPRLDDDFHSDMLAITIETTQGPLTIATNYIPPRDGYLNYIEFHRLFNRDHPII